MTTTNATQGTAPVDVLAVMKADPHYQARGDMLADAHTLHMMGATKAAEARRKYAYKMYPLPVALANVGGEA
jgi:hypothetical protein